VVRSGKPGRPSAYCDLLGHTRAKAWAARRAYDSGDEHGQTVAVPAGESVVDRPVSYGRMVKKQQMRWTPRGAHLLLQIRTRVLNDELATDFHRWYPGFAHTADRQALAA
jgi:hypothetical protein